MPTQLRLLAALARELQEPLSLEDMLQKIVDATAALLKTNRVTIRLLDASRSRLLATCRAGKPVNIAAEDFRLGEGLIGWVADRARALRTGDAENDPRYVVRPGGDKIRSFLAVPLMEGGDCVGVVSALHPSASYFTEEHEDIATLVAAVCAPRVEVSRLERLANVDPLTGALNRRGLDDTFPDRIESRLLSVIVADIDHFKSVNDRLGHHIGDEVLKRFAGLLTTVLRGGDSVVRLGGEEFLLVLPNVPLATAAKIAERARSAIERTDIPAGKKSIRVTSSFGVAERRANEERDSIIRRADEALYAAKKGGRNRVEIAD